MTGMLPLIDRMRRLVAMASVVLLGLQVAQSFYPVTLTDANGDLVQVVICGPEGLQTVTIDLSDGSLDDSPAPDVTSKCPFCVVGLPAALQAPNPIAQAAEYHRIRYGLSPRTQAAPRRAAQVRFARAPPLMA